MRNSFEFVKNINCVYGYPDVRGDNYSDGMVVLSFRIGVI